MTARFADNLREGFLSVGKFVDQPLKAFRLFDCRQVFAQQVFDQGNFQHLLVVHAFDNYRHFRQTGHGGSAKTPFTGDNFVFSVFPFAHQQRLQYAFFANRLRKSLKRFPVKIKPRLIGARAEVRKAQVFLAGGVNGVLRSHEIHIAAEQSAQAAAETFPFVAVV